MIEKMTLHRWFWVWDFEKEEQWLNGMAQEGWALEGVGFCTFHFTRCEPGEYTVRLVFAQGELDYRTLLEDSGAEYIGCMGPKWQYYRKKAEAGVFEIFSDLDSRIGQLRRISRMLLLILAANFLIGLPNVNRLGWLNLLCCAVLAYGLGRIHGKQEELERERLLHE